MSDKRFLEYRPEEISYRKPNTIVEKTKDNNDIKSPLIKDFVNHSPSETLETAKNISNELNDLINEISNGMNKEEVEKIKKHIDDNEIHEVSNLRKEASKDIKRNSLEEFFPYLYKIKKDLDENILSFMLETFGKEINLKEAKEKTNVVLNQIQKNLGTINIDAIYMDTLYNYCLIDKAFIVEDFLEQVDLMFNNKKENSYKSKKLKSVINKSFNSLITINDRHALKIEQFIFSDIYKSINNQMISNKAEVLEALEVSEEVINMAKGIKDSINTTVSVSNNSFINSIEDYLKANKTLKMLLNDYLNSLYKKDQLRIL